MTFFVAGATFGDVGESLSTARAPFVDFAVLLLVTSVVFDDFGVTLLVRSPSVVSSTLSSTVPESTRFPKIQLYQASHVDVCQLLWGIEAPKCEISMKMDSVNSDLVDRVNSIPF